MLQFEYYHENPIFTKRQKGQKDKKSKTSVLTSCEARGDFLWKKFGGLENLKYLCTIKL